MGNEISVTPPPESLNWTPEEAKKKEEQRKKIANEILETEKTYVDGLQILKQYWLTPLKTKSKTADDQQILSDAEIREVFGNIDVLLEYGQVRLPRNSDPPLDFLKLLQARLKKFVPSTVLGDIWLKKGDCFAVYAEYINGYDSGAARLKALKEGNKKFAAFNEAVYHDHQDFLIMPVQRLPRYKLLLAELQKYTPGTHRDYAPIHGAIEKISELLKYINQQKRAIDDESTLEGLTEAIDVPKGKSMNLLSATRIIKRDAELTYTNAKGKPSIFLSGVSRDLIHFLQVLKQNKALFSGKKIWKFVAHESFSDTWLEEDGVRWPKHPELVLHIKNKQLDSFLAAYKEAATAGKVDGGELPLKEGFLTTEFLIFKSERWVVLKPSSLAWFEGAIESTRKEQGSFAVADVTDCTTESVGPTEFAIRTSSGRKVWKARDGAQRDEWVVAIQKAMEDKQASQPPRSPVVEPKRKDSKGAKPDQPKRKDSKGADPKDKSGTKDKPAKRDSKADEVKDKTKKVSEKLGRSMSNAGKSMSTAAKKLKK